jgi:hypothetical protein
MLSATASDPAFGCTILPEACGANACWFHAARCQHIGHLCAEFGLTIQDLVAVWTGFRKCFPQLLHDPGAGRVFRDVETKVPTSTMFDEEAAIQDSERAGRHSEEVDGSDDVPVIAKESSPELAGTRHMIMKESTERDDLFGETRQES